MKKKVLLTLLCVLALSFCIGLTGCNLFGEKVVFDVHFTVDGIDYAVIGTSGKATIQMPENPQKDGYTFDGWYWDNEMWQKPFTANSLFDAALSSDMRVYAKFSEIHVHNYVGTVVPPTCIEQGYTLHKCACGDEYNDDFVNVLGHSLVHHEAKASTCTETGWGAYDTCEHCDYTTYEELPALGHLFTNYVSDGNATCTRDGTKTAYCDHEGCNKIDTIADEGSKCHELVHHEAKAPTCTEIGWSAYDTCKHCDYSTYEELPALDHLFTNYVSDGNATCTRDGTKTARCDHEGCNATDTVIEGKLGHALVHHEAKAPTCTEVGWYAYDACKRKRCDYTTYEELPALDHALIHHEAKAPTADEVGWFAYDTCERCNYTTYEVWNIGPYTYNFYTEQGGTVYNTQIIEENSSAIEPTVPTKKGYYFAGWYDGDTEYNFATLATKDMNLYAKWLKVNCFEAEYTEIPDDKRGYGSSDNVFGTQIIQYVEDVTINGEEMGISNRAYVGKLYYNGAFVEFKVNAAEECDVVIMLRLTPDIYNFTLTDEEYFVMVNGTKLKFGSLVFNDAYTVEMEQAGEIQSVDLEKRPFENYVMPVAHLNKGDNVIRIQTNNSHDHGGTYSAETPLLDCIYVCADVEVGWAEGACHPENYNGADGKRTMADVDLGYLVYEQ